MNELKVGLLALLALGSIIVVSLQITSNKANFGEFVEYQAIIDDATGIYQDSSIKVAGIVAGKINEITLSGSKALVRFEVKEEIKITAESSLRIKSVGFLGDKYIDINIGNQVGERLPENSMMNADTGAGFAQIGKDASEILKDVKVIAKAIKESMYTSDNKNAIKLIVGQINEFSHNANKVSQSLRKLIEGNEAQITNTLDNLNRVTAQLAYETDRHQEDSFMNSLEDVGPILAKVNQSVTDLRDIVADVKAGKGTVGQLLRNEEVVDKVNETLSGVNRIVSRVNRFETDISMYSGTNNIEGSKTQLNLDLIASPERFFRFGVTLGDGTRLDEETTTTSSVDDGPETTTNKVEVKENAWRFDVQIGRKVNDFGFRVGLIESTGGLGVDYFIPAYGFQSSIEVFDSREDIGMNLRLGTELRIWNILHAKILAEDLSRDSQYHIFTFSAGLKFSDEDLASIIGLAL